MTIAQQYKAALKAAQKRRRYYIKNYGLALPEVAKTKKPTKASIRRLERLYRGGEERVAKYAADYEKRHHRQEPIQIDVVIKTKIEDILDEAHNEAQGMGDERGDWLEWKVNEVDRIISESGKTLSEIDAVFEPLDRELERYLYDSGNRKNNQYLEFLHKVQDILLGIPQPHSIEYDFSEGEL